MKATTKGVLINPISRWLLTAVVVMGCATLAAAQSNITFLSVRSGVPLPQGFNLAEAGLKRASGEPFPMGPQIVQFIPVSQPFDARYEPGRLPTTLEAEVAERYHVVLTDSQAIGERFPASLSELTAAEQASLDGPWTLWLDSRDEVGKTVGRRFPGAPNRTSERFLACVQDGKVTVSYVDMLIMYPPRFETFIEDCLTERDFTNRHAASPLSAVSAPPFSLRNEHGEVLDSDDLRGEPFALLIPSNRPEAEEILAVAQARLGFARIDIPIYVLALPTLLDPDGIVIDAAEVASHLRGRLELPVYEDARGDFVDRFSYFYKFTTSLLLFDEEGRILEGFFGAFDLPFIPGETLEQALVRLDLF
jgi:hypothetical protein